MTLVEVTVAVGLLGVVLSIAMSFFSSALMRGTELSEQTELQAETRLVLDQLVRELRQATSGSTSTAAIETMQSGTITFLSPDQGTPYAMRRISYTVDTATKELRRAIVTSTDTDGVPWVIGALPAASKVLGSVQNAAVFSYKDDAGAVTTIPAAVHTVEITLDIDPFPGSGSPAHTYKAAVHVRAAL